MTIKDQVVLLGRNLLNMEKININLEHNVFQKI